MLAKAQRRKDVARMNENEISKHIVQAAFDTHSELGPGLLETVYEVAMDHLLRERFRTVRQQRIPIRFRGLVFDEGFRADIIVSDLVLVELKSVEALLPVHKKQVLTYLKLTGLKLGILINFNTNLIKDGIARVVNGLPSS